MADIVVLTTPSADIHWYASPRTTVLTCFEDQDARVRYYACESLYNISKVARGAVLVFFNNIFDGLCKVRRGKGGREGGREGRGGEGRGGEGRGGEGRGGEGRGGERRGGEGRGGEGRGGEGREDMDEGRGEGRGGREGKIWDEGRAREGGEEGI